MPAKKSSKKDSGEAEKKAPERKKPMNKRRSGGQDDDDDSVDSHGNIRALIAYDGDTSDESWDSEDDTSNISKLTPEQRQEIRRSVRRAAMKARKRIQVDSAVSSPKEYRKKVVEESEESEEEAPKKRSGFIPRKKKVVEESEEESEEETPKKRSGFMPRKKKVVEESEEESEEEDEEEEEETEDEEYEDGRTGLIISFGGGEEEPNNMVPKRHNMKKESADVKKFVQLLTKQQEEGGIDDQIDEFKRQTPEKQREILVTLDRKPGADPNSQSMMFKILSMKISPEVQSMVLARYNTLQNMDPGSGEYFKMRGWLEKFSSLPLGIYKDIPAKLSDGTESCGLFMERARRCLDEAIFGQQEAKIQILQFIASKITNPGAAGLSLLLAGPPGIGKTSLIKNGIAKALNWPFQFISLGGDSDASTYTGHQVVYEGSHCGKIVNSLVAAKSMSMVLMFDELDKISTTAKGEEVQNLLVHLTDSVQNSEFEDKYLSGIPLDLSKVMFSFSANDLGKIDRVLLDRMIVINLEGYSKKDKMSIAENFLLPTALKEVALQEKVAVGQEVLEHIMNEYASEEKGVRELKRCIEAVTQKINMLRIFNTKDLPFHIPDFQLPFVLKKAHVDLFLKKKKPELDPSLRGMYT
jgi:ATP-dependent Lon protease